MARQATFADMGFTEGSFCLSNFDDPSTLNTPYLPDDINSNDSFSDIIGTNQSPSNTNIQQSNAHTVFGQTAESNSYIDSQLSPNAFSEVFSMDQALSNIGSQQSNAHTPFGHAVQSNADADSQWSPTTDSNASTRIQVLAQPSYGGRLRYRSDYVKNAHRLGVLKNRTKDSSYVGPAIRIPTECLDRNEEYCIRVCLVTVPNSRHRISYIHPYVLENPTDSSLNDTRNNSVYSPIHAEEWATGIKSFPLLRIVKTRQNELKDHGNLQPFDNNVPHTEHDALPQSGPLALAKAEFEIDRTQLAFTVGTRVLCDGAIVFYPLSETTAFSAVMIEGEGLEPEDSPENQSSADNRELPVCPCRVYKYAPRYCLNTHTGEDMIIFLTHKLEPKRYGALKVTFQYDTVGISWSQPIDELDIKDRIVSFKIPVFPYEFNGAVQVKIVLEQEHRQIDRPVFFYLSSGEQCLKCQLNSLETQMNTISNASNKRFAQMDDSENDCLKQEPNTPPSLERLSLDTVPGSPASPPATVPQSASTSLARTTSTADNSAELIVKALADNAEALFLRNDSAGFLRMCRSFIRKRPELLHAAVRNNNTDLLGKFIPIASLELLQLKNDAGENVLVHAVRLNLKDVVAAVLAKNDVEVLMVHLNGRKNNLFHFMAAESTPIEIVDLIIDHLVEKSVSISAKFDHPNDDDQTPLQLSVTKNNLAMTRKLLKHFKTNVCALKNRTGDNLVHLAVRHGDLEMVRCLLEDGQLKHLGEQSNLTMTPVDLAHSLKRNDLVDYLETIYPPLQVSDSSDSEDE